MATPALKKETFMTGPATVEEYLATVPEKPRAALEKLRKTVQAVAPEAIETISYQMPAFKHHGQLLVSFAAYRDHCSLFPASQEVREALGEELEPYFSGKATIRFRVEEPLAASLVTKIVRARIDELDRQRNGRTPRLISFGGGPQHW